MHFVRIHTKDARAVAQGHPWVYRQAIAERPRMLKMGDIVDVMSAETDFVAHGIYDPASSVAVRVWSRERGERFDAALVARRAREAAALRDRLGIPERTDAFRLVHSEGDRLPGVIVDRWGDWMSVTLQGDSLRRHERTILDGLVAAFVGAGGRKAAGDETPPPGWSPKGIHLRDDDSSRLVHGTKCPDDLVVREPTGRFHVQLAGPGKPGLFTDMRDVRAILAPRTRGRSFLNLFAHTGAFSAAAAAAGATDVVSVDLSKPFLDVARRNVELNAPGARHEAVVADVFEALRRFAAEKRRFDVVLADPPTFSSSKASGAFSVRDDYRSLVRASIRVLAPGGLLVAATNFRETDDTTFLRMLHDAAEMERAPLRVLDVMGQPADHPSLAIVPETRHLHVAFAAVG